MSGHTPEEWYVIPHETREGHPVQVGVIWGERFPGQTDTQPDALIAEVFSGGGGKAQANAHLICRAVNSHDELLKAAKEARDELSQYTARWCEELAAKLDEAIEKAEQ